MLVLKVSAIKPGTSPKNTKKWDSLAHMNLVVALEKQFKIKFTDDEITEMLSYELIVEIGKMQKLNFIKFKKIEIKDKNIIYKWRIKKGKEIFTSPKNYKVISFKNILKKLNRPNTQHG